MENLNETPTATPSCLTPTTRRTFLLQLSGLAAGAALGSGATINATAAKPPPLSPDYYLNAKTQKTRKRDAYRLRTTAAKISYQTPAPILSTNGDEDTYQQTYLANFSKSLPHDDLGYVNHESYGLFIQACTEGTAEAFEAVPGGPVQIKNPLAGYAYTMEGADPYDVYLPPPPSFASAEVASEMIECYWHALMRDVPFADYESNDLAQLAALDLSRLPAFKGPRASNGNVTPSTLFRGIWPGCEKGPYLSQFLFKDFELGHTPMKQQYVTATPDLDYLSTWAQYLANARGIPTTNTVAQGPLRHLITGRDLTNLVHIDFPFETPLVAGLSLLLMQAPSNPGDPYRHLHRTCGFATFGYAHMADSIARVSTLALRTAWRHKYTLHRRLRPEEFAARVHQHILTDDTVPIHPDILSSRALQEVYAKWGSYLLPQAYPEGCPAHPAYPSGHATFVGAGITIVKAFYDENWVIPNPVIPSPDGQTLLPYTGPPLTVGGELNKLAANVAIGRNIAGVHWRTDATEGNLLGERVAIALLNDLKGCYREPSTQITFTSLEGNPVTI